MGQRCSCIPGSLTPRLHLQRRWAVFTHRTLPHRNYHLSAQNPDWEVYGTFKRDLRTCSPPLQPIEIDEVTVEDFDATYYGNLL